MNAVVLLSGGLDSAVVLAIAKESERVHALTFDYGQRHAREVEAARWIAAKEKVAHTVLPLPPGPPLSSPLTTPGLVVPKDGAPRGLPPTYVPARNTIFLAHALAWAEALDADIWIGATADDRNPDTTPEYIGAFERMARIGTTLSNLRIHAPLANATKRQVISMGAARGVDFSITHTCYDPSPFGAACGLCDACRARRKGFAEAGVPDPATYMITLG